MEKLLVISFLFTILLSVFAIIDSKEENSPYKNSNLPVDERVEDLLNRLTLEEKIELLGGTGSETKAIERLGIPPLNMTDGPG